MNIIPHDLAAEQSVIGSMMIDFGSKRCQSAMKNLKSESFYSRQHQLIFAEIIELSRKNKPVDILTISDGLEAKGNLQDCGGLAYLAELSKNTPSVANVKAYSEIVRDKAIERYTLKKLNDCSEMIFQHSSLSTSDKLSAIQKLFTEIDDYNKTGKTIGLKSLSTIADKWTETLSDRLENKDSARGLSTGIDALDKKLMPKGLVRGSLFVVGARPKMGKAQPLSSKVLLSNGEWTTFNKIKVGDSLASIDGGSSAVTGVFPRGIKDVYEVTFSDGRKVNCAGDHLWEIRSSRFKTGRQVVDTVHLLELISKVRYKNRISVPSITGDFGVEKYQGINLWLLGFLIGDGNLTGGIKFSTSESYILERVKGCLSSDLEIKHIQKYDYQIFHGRNKKHPIKESLIELGLFGKKSSDKFIPTKIFNLSRNQRIDLLMGLLESDGWVEKQGSLSYSSSSETLIDGIQKLVWSLGGVARKTVKNKRGYFNNGVKVDCLDSHTLRIRLNSDILNFIKSPRLIKNKKDEQKKTASPIVKSVKRIKDEECVCISVSHESHLYATDNYILTHNTTMEINMARRCAMVEKLPVLMFSLEMQDEQMLESILAQESMINSDIFYDGGLGGDSEFARVMHHLTELSNTDNIYIDDTPAITLSHIRSESRRMAKEKGQIGMIMVDYLTLMEKEKTGDDQRNDLAYGYITKGLKALAKELNCVVVMLTQLNRNLESRADKRPIPSDSRDTGQIEQDCDYWVGLYRDAVYNETADKNIMEINVALNRHGSGNFKVFAGIQNGRIYDIDQAQAAAQTNIEPKKKARKYADS